MSQSWCRLSGEWGWILGWLADDPKVSQSWCQPDSGWGLVLGIVLVLRWVEFGPGVFGFWAQGSEAGVYPLVGGPGDPLGGSVLGGARSQCL